MAPQELPLRSISPNMGWLAHRNVMVSYWRIEVTPADIRALFPDTDRMLARYPDGIATVNVIEQDTVAPDEARAVGAAQIRDLGTRLRCTANILLGAGFWIAAARAITSTINLISRRPVPILHTASIDDAARWLAPRLGDPAAEATAQALASAIEHGLQSFRAASRPPPAPLL
ncbi:MAG: hypothetical protein U0168_16115 [Nannocystaceae bacterium]